MIQKTLAVMIVFGVAVAFSCRSLAQSHLQGTATELAERPKSFDLDAMDTKADPCEDFYQYACGGWVRNSPIPADQSHWGRFEELKRYTAHQLRAVLERSASDNPGRSASRQKAGDFYYSCMDEQKVNAVGKAPIKPILARLDAVSNIGGLIDAAAYLHSHNVSVLFDFGPMPAPNDAGREVAVFEQGGLGLLDRDSYISSDANARTTRERYLVHITKMFSLLGMSTPAARARARTVLKIETALAQAAFDRKKIQTSGRSHMMSAAELQTLSPNVDFRRFLKKLGVGADDQINVLPPEYFQGLSRLLSSIPIADWRHYLKWQLLHSAAPVLAQAFVDENFDFYGKYLFGQKQLEPRWQRCIRLTSDRFGDAVAQLYVAEFFSPAEKERALTMVVDLETVLKQEIESLQWMSESTKKEAQAKIAGITNTAGYPDEWRNYRSVHVSRDALFGNAWEAVAFNANHELGKIGHAVDKLQWWTTPQTVDAFYNPSRNAVNFPAALLQPPFFDAKGDDSVNYGAIGAIIGHELVHGLDDNGSKYDARGNLREWWSGQDRREFEKRTACMVAEFSSFTELDGLHLNGERTLGENIADSGGLRLAYTVLKTRLLKGGGDPGSPSPSASPINGISPEQRFFLGYAQLKCENVTPEYMRLKVTLDEHAPGKWRTNGVLQNLPEFQSAFHCLAGQKMVSQNACKVW